LDETRLKHPLSDNSQLIQNSTTSDHQFSTNNHNSTQKSEIFPSEHSEESPLMNVGDRVDSNNTISFPSATSININENKSKANVTFHQEILDLQVDRVKVKELSENQESSYNPVSGRS